MMVMPSDDFDWVTARHQCSMNVIFERFCHDVQKDVQVWERVSEHQGTVVCDRQVDFLAVATNGRPDAPKVTCWLRDQAIDISRNGDASSFTVTLTLNRDRQCRFVVNGAEREGWEIRQMALDPLFFPRG